MQIRIFLDKLKANLGLVRFSNSTLSLVAGVVVVMLAFFSPN